MVAFSQYVADGSFWSGMQYPLPSWLPNMDLEFGDFDCRQPRDAQSGKPYQNSVPLDANHWRILRARFLDLGRQYLRTQPSDDVAVEVPHTTEHIEILEQVLPVMWRFQEAFLQCPIGAVTSSIFVGLVSHLPSAAASHRRLSPAVEAMLQDVRQTQVVELIARDLQLLLGAVSIQVVAASEWGTFAILAAWLRSLRVSGPTDDTCKGHLIAGSSTDNILALVRRYLPFASQRSDKGTDALAFLHAFQPLVQSLIEDPDDSLLGLQASCPGAVVAVAAAAGIFSLMVNPHLFEKFLLVANVAIRERTAEVISVAATWQVFDVLAKVGEFALRPFDMQWLGMELFQLPSDFLVFDSLRLDARSRDARLAAAATSHHHAESRRLAAFLWVSAAEWSRPSNAGRAELIVYLTALGGQPYIQYLSGFMRRALDVGLCAVVVACLDQEAFARCTSVSADLEASSVHCMRCFEGNAVLVKYGLVAVLLSAAVDVIWIDFDTYILRDPTPVIKHSRDADPSLLPRRSRVQFGPFLFDNASDVCSLTTVCDDLNIRAVTFGADERACDTRCSNHIRSPELLVTEHWGARCINSGLFYVKATHRPFAWLWSFLGELHSNPYVDNQNLFDSFLRHSTAFALVPAGCPLVRYALLDIERQFVSAEGHVSSFDELVTFHFWRSDAKALGDLRGRSSDTGRPQLNSDWTPSAIKADMFQIFYGPDVSSAAAATAAVQHGTLAANISQAGARFIESVRSLSAPAWKGMCAVSPLGTFSLELANREGNA